MTIYQRLFDLESAQRVRDAVGMRFPFLLHQTARRSLRSIRVSGLEPRAVDVAADADRDFLAMRFGGKVPPVTCLANPNKPVAHTQMGPVVALAVRTVDVRRLYLDWTFGSVWNLADVLVSDSECLTPEAVIVELLERGRSVVITEVISSELLRVRCSGSPANRLDCWPLLSEVDFSDVWSK